MSVVATRAIRAFNPAVIVANNPSVITGMIADADGEMVASKYWPPTTSPITAIDYFLTIVGDGSTVNLAFEVQADTADAPNATVLGAATAAFAGPATSNWTGAQGLVTDTGALVLGVPVWIVAKRISGASLSGALSFQLNGSTGILPRLTGFERIRHYNGANWTTTALTEQSIRLVVTHADGTIVGFPVTGNAAAPSGVTDIFGTNRQGIRLKYGAQYKIPGVGLFLTKAGSPADLVFEVYAGAVLQYSQTILAASIVSNVWFPCYFTSPIVLPANTNLYIVLKQAGDGGTDAADYDMSGYPITSGYVSAMLPPDCRFVSGTGNDPTVLTVSTTFVPRIFPMIDDPAVELDEASGVSAVLGRGLH